MLHASASGRSTFHGGTGRVPPAHDPKQTTGDDATGRGGVSGAGMPLLPATPMPSPATDPFRRNCPDHIPRTTLSCPHRPNSSPELHFPSTSPELHSPNHGRTISRQNAEAEAAEQNPVPHFPPASSDPQPPPDSQCAIIHPANGRRKPLRTDFKLRREGTSGTVQ